MKEKKENKLQSSSELSFLLANCKKPNKINMRIKINQNTYSTSNRDSETTYSFHTTFYVLTSELIAIQRCFEAGFVCGVPYESKTTASPTTGPHIQILPPPCEISANRPKRILRNKFSQNVKKKNFFKKPHLKHHGG